MPMPGFMDQWMPPQSYGNGMPGQAPPTMPFPYQPGGPQQQPPGMPPPGSTATMGMAQPPMPQARPPMPSQPMPHMRPQMPGQGFHPFGGLFGNMLGMNGQGGQQGGHPLMDLLARLGLGGGGQPSAGQSPQGLLPPWFGQQGPR